MHRILIINTQLHIESCSIYSITKISNPFGTPDIKMKPEMYLLLSKSFDVCSLLPWKCSRLNELTILYIHSSLQWCALIIKKKRRKIQLPTHTYTYIHITHTYKKKTDFWTGDIFFPRASTQFNHLEMKKKTHFKLCKLQFWSINRTHRQPAKKNTRTHFIHFHGPFAAAANHIV